MKLDVPLIKQPKDSVECGIAGLAMIFKHYNKNKSFKELKKEIETDEVGTYIPQIGTYLLKNGFKVEIITMHPRLYTIKDKNCSQAKISEIINQKLKTAKNEQDKKILSYYKEFLDNKGKIIVKIPSIDDIINEIDNKRPIGALLTTNFLLNKKALFNFHFNIITGYDKNYVYVNDPMWNELGGKKKHKIQDFFYGIHASTYGDLDNGTLIKILKK